MLGEASVGKSCMVNRFIDNVYGQSRPTVGATFKAKVMTVSPHEHQMTTDKVKLKIWDTAGDERFRSLTNMYYHDAQAVILVYDTTNEESVKSLNYWAGQISDNAAEPLIFVAGAKCDDQEHAADTFKEAATFCKGIQSKLYQTSSKDGTGID